MSMFPIRLVASCVTAALAATVPSLAVEANNLPTPTSDAVVAVAERVADAWIASHPAASSDNGWESSTFNSGNMALYSLAQDPRYEAYTRAWAAAHGFSLQSNGSKPFFPDTEAAGQPYLDLQSLDGSPSDTSALVGRLQAQMSSGGTSYWSYVDALNMSMPDFARVGAATGDVGYDYYLERSFDYTAYQLGGKGLFDPSTGLWWRDGSFVGSGIYWSRGNGWAMAALVKVLSVLPRTDPWWEDFAAIFEAMAAALAQVQRSDGFWNVDLRNPADHPGPESSGTAFFAYGMAWGILNGLLDEGTYLPIVERAWTGLTSIAVQPDGVLGYTQGPGAKPSDGQPVTARSTAAYSVGAFLIAAAEIAALGGPTTPVDPTLTPLGPGQIDLSWSPPAYDGGAPISWYAIEAIPAFSSSSVTPILTDQTDVVLENLPSGDQYTFVVAGWNGSEWSPWTQWGDWTQVP